MKIGYASADGTGGQTRALRAAGCARVFSEKKASDRIGREDALRMLRRGDVLAVINLEFLASTLRELLDVIADIGSSGANLQVLVGEIDTTSPDNRMTFTLIAGLNDFAQKNAAKRSKAALTAAKRRGVRLGRRPSLSRAQLENAQHRLHDGERAEVIARSLRVGRSTLYRALAALRRHKS